MALSSATRLFRRGRESGRADEGGDVEIAPVFLSDRRWPRRGLKLPHFPEAERCVRSNWEDRTIGFFVALFVRAEKCRLWCMYRAAAALVHCSKCIKLSTTTPALPSTTSGWRSILRFLSWREDFER